MLSWLNPLMLFGAFAAAVPLILHLLLRRRIRTVKFSRVILLQQVQRFSERHFRLKQLLLLALRVAAILLLAAAFARPWWRTAVAASEGPSKSVLCLLDVSASMRCDDRFSDAVKKSIARLDKLTATDRAGLVLFAKSSRVAAPLTSDPKAVIDVLKAQSPTFESTDIADALQAGADLLAEAPQPVRTLLLVTDLQQNAVAALSKEWRLPDGIGLEIIRVGDQPALNGAVSDVRVTAPESADAARSIRALVANHADAGSNEFEASLELDGRAVESRRFTVPAEGRRIIGFSLSEQASTAAVRIEGDSFEADDVRYVMVPPEERYAALILSAADAPPEGEALFPETALQSGPNSPYSASRIAQSALLAKVPWSVPFVIVPGETAIDEEAAEWLVACAQAGGTVLVGANSKVAQDGRPALADVAPLGWIEADPKSTIFQMLAEIDMRHPVFSPFRGLRRGNFTALDFYGHWRVSPGASSVTIATFDDGAPALVERQIGRGRVLLWTASFGPDTGNFPLRGLYVAFMRNIAQIAFARRQAESNLLIGDSVLLKGAPGGAAKVLCPDGRAVEMAYDAEGAALFIDTALPGAYIIENDPAASFAVNVDPAESDLAPAWEEELLAQLNVEEEAANDDAGPVAIAQNDTSTSSRMWRALFAALLIIVVAELWLSNHTPR